MVRSRDVADGCSRSGKAIQCTTGHSSRSWRWMGKSNGVRRRPVGPRGQVPSPLLRSLAITGIGSPAPGRTCLPCKTSAPLVGVCLVLVGLDRFSQGLHGGRLASLFRRLAPPHRWPHSTVTAINYYCAAKGC